MSVFLPFKPRPRAGSGLLAGRNGWLFWVGTRRQNIELWQDTRKMRRRLREWHGLIAGRVEACRAIGAEYRQAIVPDKLSVYAGKLVDREIDPALAFGRRTVRRLREAGLGDVAIDLHAPVQAGADGEDLYLRTDTHFTAAGYRLAYRTIAVALGVEPARHILGAATVRRRLTTDLGSKLVPPEDEEADMLAFERRAERVVVNDLARFREAQASHVAGVSVGSRSVHRNDHPEADPRRLVVFGDSFTFAEGGLGALLAESFREVHLVWSSRLDYGYLGQVRPDLVLNEIAEFFMGPIPVDDVSIGALADERLKRAKAAG